MNTELVKYYAERTERACREILGKKEGLTQKTLLEAMEYSLFAGGKRVRPFLVFAFYKACTGSDDIKPAEYYAAAIEMVHTFSLIHDDLPAMDDDDLRRGRPTSHIVYGEATAILAGDALLAEAFGAVCKNSFCTDAQNASAVRLLAQKSGAFGMTGGQQIDIQCEGVNVSREVLRELQELKTGCLISCACMLGCIAAGATKEQIDAAEEYGKCLGLAFQVKDDILDVEGSEGDMGKAVNKDSIIHKATYPSVYGIEHSKLILRTLTEKAVKCIEAFPCKEGRQVLTEYTKALMERIS